MEYSGCYFRMATASFRHRAANMVTKRLKKTVYSSAVCARCGEFYAATLFQKVELILFSFRFQKFYFARLHQIALLFLIARSQNILPIM